jgi:glucokinase
MSANIEYVVALDLGGTNLRVAAVDRKGAIRDRQSAKTGVADGYRKVIDRIVSGVAEIARRQGIRPSGIGVGVPGAIDYQTGAIVSSPNFPDWKNVPFAADVAEACGLPVTLENDANAAALGERFAGAAKGWDEFLMFTLGTGVGSGLVLNGRLWRGPTGKAAEAGHLTVVPDGRLCGCGRRGCLEQYASATGIRQTGWERAEESDFLRPHAGGRIGGKLIADGAAAGDDTCLTILAEAGAHLGRAMASVALLLDVTRFVIGGGMAKALPYMEAAARRTAVDDAFTLTPDRVEIVAALSGDDAGILGAAARAWDEIGG